MFFEQLVAALAVLLCACAIVRQPMDRTARVTPIFVLAIIWVAVARIAIIHMPAREPSAAVEAYPLVLMTLAFAYRFFALPKKMPRPDRIDAQARQLQLLALIAGSYIFICSVMRQLA